MIEVRYRYLVFVTLYSFPKVGCKAVSVSRYALPYHSRSSRAWNILVMPGNAVLIMVVSSATRKVPK
jgi:hypothetical protein